MQEKMFSKDLYGKIKISDVCNHKLFGIFKNKELVVQWLRLRAPNAGRPGSIPGQRTRSCMLQLQIPHAATKRSRMLQLNDPECRN